MEDVYFDMTTLFVMAGIAASEGVFLSIDDQYTYSVNLYKRSGDKKCFFLVRKKEVFGKYVMRKDSFRNILMASSSKSKVNIKFILYLHYIDKQHILNENYKFDGISNQLQISYIINHMNAGSG